ncbi:hypothetical protein WOA01_17020 [Methylocystis sp. IM2]
MQKFKSPYEKPAVRVLSQKEVAEVHQTFAALIAEKKFQAES